MRPRHNAASLLAASLLTGLTSPASAQSITVSLTHDDADSLVQLGETTTWTLAIAFEGFSETSIVSGLNATLAATEPGSGTVSDFEFNYFRAGSGGGASNGGGFD